MDAAYRVGGRLAMIDVIDVVAAIPGDWVDSAACRGRDPDLFYPVGTAGPALRQVDDAKAVCARCPVADDCLRWALDEGEPHGIWGGATPEERRYLRRRDPGCGVRELRAVR